MSKKITYKLDNKGDFIKIYINGSLHLSILRNELRGFQSYISYMYCIELYVKDQTILCEYDSINKWKAILQLLDTI